MEETPKSNLYCPVQNDRQKFVICFISNFLWRQYNNVYSITLIENSLFGILRIWTFNVIRSSVLDFSPLDRASSDTGLTA